MNKKNIIFISIFSLVFLLIGYNFIVVKMKGKELNKTVKDESMLKIEASSAIITRTVKKLEKEKQLKLVIIGNKDATKVVEKPALGFKSMKQGPFDLINVRKLLVYAVDLYLNEINTDENVRPYLSHHPFTNEDVKIRIFFEDRERGNLIIGTADYGNVIYAIYDGNGSRRFAHKEKYAESVNIAKSSNKDSYSEIFDAIQKYKSVGFVE
ncbi:MAG: hypothetical protein AMS24_02215 [Chlamydiae bacterium SM23_39]|nr:MAG: hypothetical protein AMS24_02215 [Chlamydiae bacterium SM23_39]